jgi:hypothetical protein
MHEISEISICPYLVLALCRIHRTRALSDCLSVLALSAVALALSSALSLSAGLSALGSLRWLSALWRWLLAQRCLSALGYQRLALCAGSQRCGAGSLLSAVSQRWAITSAL